MLRWLLTRPVAVVVAGTALLVASGSPANARASGAGWDAWWTYITPDTIKYQMHLPGANLYGTITDDEGQWTFNGILRDTAPGDGRCAEAAFTSTLGDTQHSWRECDGKALPAVALVTFHGGGTFRLHIVRWPGGVYEKTSFMPVPGSSDDPTLRTAGTGAKWMYTSDTHFWFQAERPDARISGTGYHHDLENRLAIAEVELTQPAVGCVIGSLRGSGTEDVAATCVPNAPQGLGLGQLDSWILAEACYLESIVLSAQCIAVMLPEPI
jgi:hypothetical protein